MIVKIDVTEGDINNGKPLFTHACPIALAVRRLGFSAPHVTRKKIEMRIGKVRYSAPLPLEATEFIDCFDEGILLDAFSFEVEFNQTT